MSLATPGDFQARSNNPLRMCRESRGWSLDKAARELHKLGEEARIPDMPTVASIKRQLIRHESGTTEPRKANDLYVRLYEMGYDVTGAELFGALQPSLSADGRFAVRAHQFVPVFVGPHIKRLNSSFDAEPCDVGWSSARRADLDIGGVQGELYLFEWGVAVLHVVTEARYSTITDLAHWRRDTHRTTPSTLATHLSGLLEAEVDAPYVLTALWLAESIWAGRDLDTAMRILCSPRALFGSDSANAHSMEKRLFKQGFAPTDQVPFGVDGLSHGWASWPGVAYHPMSRSALSDEDLVTTELLAQGLWSYCHGLAELDKAGGEIAVIDGFGSRWLRGRRMAMMRAGPAEPQQLRALRAAIVHTSELDQQLDDTVDLLREAGL